MSHRPHRKGTPPPAGHVSLWRTLKAVLWGFFGVRKDSEFLEDRDRISPLGVVGIALVVVIAIVLNLILLAKFMASL